MKRTLTALFILLISITALSAQENRPIKVPPPPVVDIVTTVLQTVSAIFFL